MFHIWTGPCWTELEDGSLRKEAYNFFADAVYPTLDGIMPFQPTRHKIADLVDALQAAVHLPRSVVPPAWLEPPGAADGFVSCGNGILHVPSRKLQPHSPRLFVQHHVPFEYRPDAPMPRRWLRFLDELWPGDPESIRAVQQLFGYVLSGSTALQKAFMIVGPKRSGKGTIARILTALIGRHHVAGSTLAGLATNFGLQPLIGKPLTIISDARITDGHSRRSAPRAAADRAVAFGTLRHSRPLSSPGGHERKDIHVVVEDLDHAREQWVGAFAREQADRQGAR